MNNSRIHSLDSLRGIAAMIVVIYHSLLSFPSFYEANYNQGYSGGWNEVLFISPINMLWAGREAVLLFFILSGFVLSLVFLQSNRPTYKNYIIKRFFRIYIPYLVIMLLSSLLVTLLYEYKTIDSLSPTYDARWGNQVTVQAIIAYILMIDYDTTNVNGVVWTLIHEMRISLFFPLLMFIVIRFNWIKSLVIGLGTVLGAFVIFRVLSGFIPNNVISDLVDSFGSTFYYSSFFVMGAVLAKYRNEISLLFRKVNPSWVIPLLLLALFLINNKWVNVFYDINVVQITDYMSAIGLILLMIVAINSVKTGDLLTKKPLLWLGKISYSLYLVHIPIIMLTTIFTAKFLTIEFAFVLAILLSMMIAHIAQKTIEVPSIKLGRWFTNIKKQNRPKRQLEDKSL